MIIQSSNKPIVIELDMDISAATSVEISLQKSGEELQHWDMADSTVSIAENIVQITVTQEETAAYPAGNAEIFIKALLDNKTEFWDKIPAVIRAYPDHTIMELVES